MRSGRCCYALIVLAAQWLNSIGGYQLRPMIRSNQCIASQRNMEWGIRMIQNNSNNKGTNELEFIVVEDDNDELTDEMLAEIEANRPSELAIMKEVRKDGTHSRRVESDIYSIAHVFACILKLTSTRFSESIFSHTYSLLQLFSF
jgi:hypothetical protein